MANHKYWERSRYLRKHELRSAQNTALICLFPPTPDAGGQSKNNAKELDFEQDGWVKKILRRFSVLDDGLATRSFPFQLCIGFGYSLLNTFLNFTIDRYSGKRRQISMRHSAPNSSMGCRHKISKYTREKIDFQLNFAVGAKY